jgi:hypothetical protein
MRFPLVLVILAFAAAAVADPKKPDWAAKAKAVPWTLSKDTTVLDHIRRVENYDVALVREGANGGFGDLTIRIQKAGKVLHEWKGHHESPFVIVGDVLYYSEHSPIASGATIVAVDLKAAKQKWKTHLKGLGPISHSKYRNQVALAVAPDVVTVQSEESSGSYVELVDPATGKTLATDVRKRP